MTRRCSHCSHNGHNSRTCTSRGGGVKLFGVRLTDGSIIKKSASMGNLSTLHHSSSSSAASPNPSSPAAADADAVDGYLSDDPAHASCSAKRRADRKKGTPWTEEEHRLFLLGLQKLGKGDWRGIARNFVLSRTPTQVASHAQKYFIRQCGSTRRKRRSSLFDMAPDTAAEQSIQPDDHFMLPPQAAAMDSDHSIEATPSKMIEDIKEEASTNVSELPPLTPAFYPAYVPILFPLWPSNATPPEKLNNNNNDYGNNNNNNNNKVLKPIPVLPKEPMNVEELVGMSSQLTLNETDQCHMEPSALSLKLRTDPSRQSAFHASIPPVSGSGVNKGEGNIVQAI